MFAVRFKKKASNARARYDDVTWRGDVTWHSVSNIRIHCNQQGETRTIVCPIYRGSVTFTGDYIQLPLQDVECDDVGRMTSHYVRDDVTRWRPLCSHVITLDFMLLGRELQKYYIIFLFYFITNLHTIYIYIYIYIYNLHTVTCRDKYSCRKK